LKSEVPKLKTFIKQKTLKNPKSTASANSDGSSSDGSEGDEQVADLPVMGAP